MTMRQPVAKAICAILLLLILSIPLVFSLFAGVLFSQVLVVYVKELLVSIVFVVTFSVTWQVLNDPTAVKRAILVGLLRLLLSAQEKPIIPASTLEVSSLTEFLAQEYSQLEALLGSHLLEALLKVCRVNPTPLGENHLVRLYDPQTPNIRPQYIQIKSFSWSIEKELERLGNYQEEEKIALGQLAAVHEASEAFPVSA